MQAGIAVFIGTWACRVVDFCRDNNVITALTFVKNTPNDRLTFSTSVAVTGIDEINTGVKRNLYYL